jgi:hypothetical protein
MQTPNLKDTNQTHKVLKTLWVSKIMLVFLFQIFYSFLPLFVSSQTTFAQSKTYAVSVPPVNPNLTENGKRQGKWTILLNAKKGKVDSVKNATYYIIAMNPLFFLNKGFISSTPHRFKYTINW